MEDNADIGIAGDDRLRHVAVLDAERASDIGNRIGVPSSTGKLAGAGNSRCQTTPAPSPTPSGAAA